MLNTQRYSDNTLAHLLRFRSYCKRYSLRPHCITHQLCVKYRLYFRNVNPLHIVRLKRCAIAWSQSLDSITFDFRADTVYIKLLATAAQLRKEHKM